MLACEGILKKKQILSWDFFLKNQSTYKYPIDPPKCHNREPLLRYSFFSFLIYIYIHIAPITFGWTRIMLACGWVFFKKILSRGFFFKKNSQCNQSTHKHSIDPPKRPRREALLRHSFFVPYMCVYVCLCVSWEKFLNGKKKYFYLCTYILLMVFQNFDHTSNVYKHK